jgi:hypothetical protein
MPVMADPVVTWLWREGQSLGPSQYPLPCPRFPFLLFPSSNPRGREAAGRSYPSEEQPSSQKGTMVWWRTVEWSSRWRGVEEQTVEGRDGSGGGGE